MAKSTDTKRKKHSWLFRLSFAGVSVMMSALLLLACVSVVVDPAKVWWMTLFGLLYPLVFPITFILFIWSLFRRSHMRGLLAIALIPSIFFAGKYYRFTSPAEDAEGELKIVSYNVGLFAHGPEGISRTALADSVAEYLMKTDADIISIQEFRLPNEISIDKWLSSKFPGYKAEYYVMVGSNGRFGNVTLSKMPISGKGRSSFEHTTNMALWTDIQLESGALRFYNCHFESYNISLPALVKEKDAVEETEKKMRRSITERPKQVSEVLRGVDSAPVHSVVLGDFNDTPISYTYFRLLRGRKDSFSKAGKGFGATHRSLWPLLRIDYILVPKELEAVSHKVDKVKYSDHYPVIATYHESGRNTI